MPALLPVLGDVADFAALSLLALIQGLTEFLPISSSGHLVLVQTAIEFDEPGLAVDIALHVGTLIAVFVVYRRDLLAIARGAELREVGLIVLGTLPAGLVGIAFGDRIEEAFHSPELAAWGLLVTAAVLTVGELFRRRRRDHAGGGDAGRPLSWRVALAIGLAQALAIWPGVSRSGSTIACGLVCGLEPRAAARFSFLLSIPAILGAAVLSLPEALDRGGLSENRGAIVWASLLAGFVGWGALRILLAFLGRGAFAWFAVYCLALGGGYLIFA